MAFLSIYYFLSTWSVITKKEFSRALSCHVALSSKYACLGKQVCVRKQQKSQWPRVYSLDRPRFHGHMPSLVGDSGQVFRVLGYTQFTIDAAML